MSEARPARRDAGRYVRFALSLPPFIGMLVLVPLVNRTEPFVLGLPFLLFWVVLWVILTSVCMTIVYFIDPANKAGAVEDGVPR
jgi:hypothetical protein